MIDFWTSILFSVAAVALGMRQIVLSPTNETFPRAPWPVRGAMFVMLASLAGAAVAFWNSVQTAGPYAGEAGNLVAWIAGGLAGYHLIMAGNILRQRYTPEVWLLLAPIAQRCDVGAFHPWETPHANPRPPEST